MKSLAETFDDHWIKDERGCHIWRRSKTRGYGKLHVRGRLVYAHRYAYERANGRVPRGRLVLHKCDVPACVNHKHLFVGSAKDNVADMDRKGRANRPVFIGTDHGMARLTDNKVRTIRHRRAAGETCTALAGEYGVSPVMISRIALRKAWTHI